MTRSGGKPFKVWLNSIEFVDENWETVEFEFKDDGISDDDVEVE